MKKGKKSDNEVKKALLKKAYDLGYEVGYYGHMEDISWIKEERESIIERAIEIGLDLEEVTKAYQLGKKRGAYDRKQKIQQALSAESLLERLRREYRESYNVEDALSSVFGSSRPNNIKPPTMLRPVTALLKPAMILMGFMGIRRRKRR